MFTTQWIVQCIQSDPNHHLGSYKAEIRFLEKAHAGSGAAGWDRAHLRLRMREGSGWADSSVGLGYGLGSSDFPRSLCFMWFWFGLEILRLVHKKVFFAKFSKSLKIQFFCKNFFPLCQTQDFCTFLKSAQNSASFDTLHAKFWRNFFFNSYKGQCYFFRRITVQIRLKPFNISKNTFL